MKIRMGTPADAASVAALLNQLIEHRDGTALTEPVSVAGEASYIRRLLPAGCLLLAEDAGDLLGFQSVDRLNPELGEIGTFVRRESRGTGVGRALLQETWSWAEQEGVGALLADIDERNVPGLRAYRAWGFTEPDADWLTFNEQSPVPGKILLVSTA